VRIAIDARYISHGLTGGVRTYVYHLLKELPRLAPEHEFFLYADAKAPFELPSLPSNVRLRVLPWRGALSSLRNDFAIGRWMGRDAVDVVHSPGNYGPRVDVPHVVTLHDALNLFPMSQHLRGFGRHPRQIALMAYLGRQTRASLTRACLLITVSQHARDDITARTGYPRDRIDVIYEAASDDFRVIESAADVEACRRRYQLDGRIVLADGIKNPQATVQAYLALPETVRAGTQLVFFSREAAPRPAVAKALGEGRIRFLPSPRVTDLVHLMNMATVFAFPSWYEGFGLSLVEAMQCGLPVVASSRGSIPEIVAGGGLIFDLEAPRQFAAHLATILKDEHLRCLLRRKALARAKHFDWRETARQTIRVYERAADLRTRKTA
jgi:glycosyltransferase involved in cell wall biosynthesis